MGAEREQLRERAARAADEAVTAQMQDEQPTEEEAPQLLFGPTSEFVRLPRRGGIPRT